MPEPKVSITTLLEEYQPRVSGFTISFSVKRSIKVGDEFRTFASSEAWNIESSKANFEPEDAKRLAVYYTPMVLGKVFLDMYVNGGMSRDELDMRLAQIKTVYQQGVGNESAGPKEDLPGAGDNERKSSTEPAVRNDVLPGKDDRVSSEAG